jgi:hypothetical protein
MYLDTTAPAPIARRWTTGAHGAISIRTRGKGERGVPRTDTRLAVGHMALRMTPARIGYRTHTVPQAPAGRFSVARESGFRRDMLPTLIVPSRSA